MSILDVLGRHDITHFRVSRIAFQPVGATLVATWDVELCISNGALVDRAIYSAQPSSELLQSLTTWFQGCCDTIEQETDLVSLH